MDNPIDQAARCPVCDSLPIAEQAEVLGHLRVFLHCPKGHPYIFAGDDLYAAIQNWNLYISLRVQEDTKTMMKSAAKHLNSSFCRHCQQFTPSNTSFEKVELDKMNSGYSTVKHECTVCHLTKSQTEAA